MYEFILASSNKHKAEELNELMTGVATITPSSQKLEVVEDGQSFQENALKKAKAYYDHFKKPSVADDSGLVIPATPEILGIYSARFEPDFPDYKDKNLKLIDYLQKNKVQDKSAYFTCVLCFYFSPEEIYFFEGRVHGVIGDQPAGEEGFGYDPIFYPDGQNGKSLAEVSEWKMKNSHRAKAVNSALKFFSQQK
jgi:XTP/dITP diphosphohydrolase